MNLVRNRREVISNLAHPILKQVRNKALDAWGDCELALDVIGMLALYKKMNAACNIFYVENNFIFCRCSFFKGLLVCFQIYAAFPCLTNLKWRSIVLLISIDCALLN